MCMIGDTEPWEFHAEKDRRARKPHRCGECNRTIEPGETYRYGSGKCDGWFSQWKTCQQCLQATRWLNRVCDGYLIGCVQEDLMHHIRGQEEGELSSAPLVRLVRWMAADWKDRTGRLRAEEEVEALVVKALAAYRVMYDRAVAA